MSDAEPDVEYEEEEAEETPRQEKPKPKLSKREEAEQQKSEAEALMLAQKKKHEEEEAQRLREYEEQRRIQREKEEEELRQLKEKQERRRQEREEEERLFAEKRREDEEKRRREEEERKKKADEEKRKKEEEKKKKAAMMAGLKSSGPIEIQKREANLDKISKFGNIVKAKAEMGLTKEQHEEQKRKHLQEVVKDSRVDNLDVGALRAKLKEMHQRICRLEATRYDLQKRQERQEYDLKELNERQRQIARNKALKKGLDPDEAVTARHPPKVPVSSKYDRQIDRRSFGDRRYLYEAPAAVPHFPHCLPPPPTDTRSAKVSLIEQPEAKEEDKTEKQKAVFHGSARPPTTWGRRDNEELEQIRRNLEPPKYAETVKIENARPPAPYIASTVPEDVVEEE